MKINRLSQTSFESKVPKKITPRMRTSIESILLKMNSEVKRVEDGDHYRTTINTKLHFNNEKAIFEDERRLKEKLPFEKQMQGFSNLRLGKSIVLDIDNETGEIIDYKKPFLKPFFMVIRKAETVLEDIRTNFNLPQSVEKEFLTVNDLTPEGAKKIRRFVLKYEKQRLENVIKELEEGSK